MTIDNMWVTPSASIDGRTLWYVFAAGHSNFRLVDIADTEEEAHEKIRNIEAGARATSPYFDNEEEQKTFSKHIARSA